MDIRFESYLKQGKKNLIAIYVLYAFGHVLPVFPMIGGILAYLNQDAPSYVLQSHYQFALRTLVFGMAGGMLSVITNFIFIGQLIYVGVFVWFVVRSIFAIQLLLDNKPHPDPLTLWIK